MTEHPCPNPEALPLVLKVEDLTPILQIGRSTAYTLVRSGQIHSVGSAAAIASPGKPSSIT